MSEELLPCPFCGLPVRTEKSEEPRLHRPSRNGWHIACDGCELLFGYDVDYAGVFETKEEAIAAWNRRTLSKTETVEPVKDSYKLNEPLTLEELKQLKQMDKSEWVWLWFPELPKDESGWFRANMTYGVYSHECYGKTWLAYRHKKEAGE